MSKFEEFFYYPVRNFFRWKVWEPISPSTIKHYYQRARYGHSYRDTWDVDYWLIENLIPMIKILRDRNEGIPTTFIKEEDGVEADGNPTNHAIDLAGIRWRNTLGEILYGLKCARFIKNDEWGTLEPLGKRRNKKMTKSVKRSFNLIGEHLFSLWD
jgi:hypothetical protein